MKKLMLGLLFGISVILCSALNVLEAKITGRRGPIPTKAIGLTEEVRKSVCDQCCASKEEEAYSEDLEQFVIFEETEEDGKTFCTVLITTSGHEIDCDCSM